MSAGRTVNSLSVDWGTPRKYVHAVRRAFGGTIDLDPCSNAHSVVHGAVEYRLPEKDGLKEPWNFRTIFVNPPYGADRSRGTRIKDWLRRCHLAAKDHGSLVIALVPVATNTSHWKHYVWGSASSIAFLYDTRLKFLVEGQDCGKGAPMSCAMVYWGNNLTSFAEAFAPHGAVVDIRDLHTPATVAGTDLFAVRAGIPSSHRHEERVGLASGHPAAG